MFCPHWENRTFENRYVLKIILFQYALKNRTCSGKVHVFVSYPTYQFFVHVRGVYIIIFGQYFHIGDIFSVQ